MNFFRALALLLCHLAILPTLAAQKSTDLKKAGEKAFSQERWPEALDLLGRYQQEKPGDLGVLTKLGIVHYQLHHGEKARQHLEYVISQQPDSKDADLHYYMGRILHGLQEYDRAIPFYKAFLRVAGEKNGRRAGVIDQIRRCALAPNIPPSPAVALVENLGDRINTAGDEFAPFMAASQTDRLYFSAAREGSTGGRRNNEGYEDTLTGRWSSDMYVSRQAPSGWEAGEAVNSLLNTPRHEVALDFSSQGQVLYFFRGFTLYSGEIFADTTGRKDEYALQPPLFASSMQPEEGDQAPYFFDDTTLMFASRRPGGQGGLDLYITNFRGGAWTMPQNLGPAVNSPYDETTPFLSVDGRTLYFSSNRVEGLGGLDVFKAVFQDSIQAWTAPQNLGTPVNSPGEDAYFRLAPDGRTAYFSSNRLESLGWRDLYIAYFKDQQAEQAGVSRPLLFTSVGKPDPATLADGGNGLTPEAAGPRLRPLFYDNDRDVTARDNLRQIDDVAALARSYPDAVVVVTVHTDETGPAKFDLYYGIKRAEAIGKALTDRGLAASRIVLRSAGPSYPLVGKTAVDSTGIDLQRLNRRIEVDLVSPSGTLPENIRLNLPAPPPGQESAAAAQYRQLNRGLYFGVEAATTRQILTNDALYRFNDIQIESQPGAGSYRYTVGMVKKYEQAAQLRRDLERQGFREARVAAFIDGRPVSRAEAVGLLRQYPELMVYIRG